MAGPVIDEAAAADVTEEAAVDKKALKAQAKAAKAAKAAEKKAAKAAEKEAAKAGKPDGGKAAQKASKAAEKAKKKAEKELMKEQKRIDKAARKQAKKGKATVVTVGQARSAVQSSSSAATWTDDVDEDSTVEPAGPTPVGSLMAPDAVPTASKLAVTPLGGQPTPETADLVAFLNPVSSVRNCWLQRRDKKCLVLYDSDSDSFVACARLVQNKVGKDQFWRIYRSPQAMTCDKAQLTKDERLAYVGKFDQTLYGPGLATKKFVLSDQRTDAKCEHLLITLKKKNKAAAYKVRCPNMLDRIYRSTEPTYNKATKVHTYPHMTLENTKESIKNFVLQLEGTDEPSEPVVEMGKRLDDEWDLRVRAPFSVYQAFGMAVGSCYGT